MCVPVARKSLPTRLPAGVFWALVGLLAGAALAAACAAPGARFGDVPRAASAIHEALRSGYENARRTEGAERELVTDPRGSVV
jgi:hypothetical protein